ncbi:MAG: DUF5329 domain-containing protein [Halioglobus sp.]
MNKLLATLFSIALSSSAWAADQTDTEVQYLLSYVQSSGCTFHRNGSDHESADAADHLRLKYKRGGKYASTADQFIDRLASESSWSGDKYTVTCDGKTQLSSQWLHFALDEYRKSNS